MLQIVASLTGDFIVFNYAPREHLQYRHHLIRLSFVNRNMFIVQATGVSLIRDVSLIYQTRYFRLIKSDS
jgi:hypothetical protein